MRPAVFLDRDGTVNVRPAEHEYLTDPEQFRWLPGALEGMLSLARAGLPLIIVSNQRGVARGLVSRASLDAIETHIQVAMAAEGVQVESFRYCVHDLDEGCECRKPKPGLLCAAARDLALDLPRSWMIGDSLSDVQAGHAAGCRTIRIAQAPDATEWTAPSLRDAAAIVLGER